MGKRRCSQCGVGIADDPDLVALAARSGCIGLFVGFESLFAEMERQGRITTRDWSLYDFGHVVFEPRGMSPETLRAGHAWIQSRFYSRASTWRRIARAFGHLSPAAVLHAMAPLNPATAPATVPTARSRTRLGEALRAGA